MVRAKNQNLQQCKLQAGDWRLQVSNSPLSDRFLDFHSKQPFRYGLAGIHQMNLQELAFLFCNTM